MVRPKNKIVIFLLIIALSFLIVKFFSYKLLDVPVGLTADEAAFGKNAALLSHTGYDENGRHLPFFVLSLNGKDWRQPVTQYYMTIFFKLFGATIYNIRFSTIFITLFSSYILFYLLSLLFKNIYLSIAGTIIFLTIPLITIQSHLGLDNIMPIPFTIIWLIGIYQYSKTKNLKHLIYSAVSLGINFYTYKGMRAVTPIWSVLSVFYIFSINNFSLKKLKPILVFCFSILPFFAIIPILNLKYANAVFDSQKPEIKSIYNFLYPYISNFDLSFLFIKGDATPYHSTGYHGMFLLATLPLFIYGIYKTFKSSSFIKFVLLCLFTAPLLYGTVGSVYRASRIMCIIPLFCILITLSLKHLLKAKKYLLIFIAFTLITINFYDFYHYYLNDYRLSTKNFLTDMSIHKSYEALKKQSILLNLKPYIVNNINDELYKTIYFNNKIEILSDKETLPKNSILLSHRENIPELNRLNIKLPYYYLHINK